MGGEPQKNQDVKLDQMDHIDPRLMGWGLGWVGVKMSSCGQGQHQPFVSWFCCWGISDIGGIGVNETSGLWVNWTTHINCLQKISVMSVLVLDSSFAIASSQDRSRLVESRLVSN